jgi:hypothetical protein
MTPVAIRESPLPCTLPRTRKAVCTQMNGDHLPHNRLNTNHFPVLQNLSNSQLFFFHALGHHLAKVWVGWNTGGPSAPSVPAPARQSRGGGFFLVRSWPLLHHLRSSVFICGSTLFSLFYFLFSASQLFGNSDEHFRRIFC